MAEVGDPREGIQPAPTLGQKALSGVLWMAGARLSGRCVMLVVRLCVLSRLLGPNNMGVYGYAVLIIGILAIFSQVGLYQALIQRTGSVERYYSTVWVTASLRGLILGALVFMSAPWVGAFFEEPLVIWPMRVLALCPILDGLQSIGLVQISRELDFRKLFVLQFGGMLADAVVSIIVALFITPTAWALVAGRLAAIIYNLVSSYALTHVWVRPRFVWSHFLELYRFGFWIFVSGLLTYSLINGGGFVVGKLLNTSDLGRYQMAYLLATMPSLEIGRIIYSVTFPVFSKIQAEPERLQVAFLKSLLLVGIVTFWILACTFTLAQDAVGIIFDERWIFPGALIPCLAIWGVCQTVEVNSNSLFMSIGRPNLSSLFQLFMVITMAILIVPVALRHGMIGISVLMAAIGLCALLLRTIVLAKTLRTPVGKVLINLFVPMAASILAISSAGFLRQFVIQVPALARLILIGAATSTIYALGILVMSRWTSLNITEIIRMVLPIQEPNRNSAK